MSDNNEKDEEKPVVAKTAVDLQRLKLMKLMKNMVSCIPNTNRNLIAFTRAKSFSIFGLS